MPVETPFTRTTLPHQDRRPRSRVPLRHHVLPELSPGMPNSVELEQANVRANPFLFFLMRKIFFAERLPRRLALFCKPRGLIVARKREVGQTTS